MSRPFIFSGRIISEGKSESSKLIKRNNPISLSPTQKLFNSINPVRPFHRFRSGKITSGNNPDQSYIEFISKDINKPLERPNLHEKAEKYIPSNPLRWSIGCTYHCNDKNLVPKYSNFKEYYFSERKNSDVEKYESSFLPTDHISIRVPEINKIYNEDSFLNMKRKYGSFAESESHWVPRVYKNGTIANRNSVNYNILNNSENNISGKREDALLDKNANHKKKGVAEFEDFRNPSNPNFNYRYQNLFKDNDKIFFNYKGVFSDLYDSAVKNGNIYMPFRREKDEFKKNKRKFGVVEDF